MTTNKIVVIEWIDSVEYEDAEWKTQEEADSLEPMRIKSAGILIKDEKSHITIASSINKSDPESITYGGLLTIPSSVIVKRSDFPRGFTDEVIGERMKEIIDGDWPGPGV
tara:strand:- start:125 stop:454 length:330 start_codon:yes stop_codon:yes gene_type:complete